MNNELNFRKPLEVEEVIKYLSSFISVDFYHGDNVMVAYINSNLYQVSAFLKSRYGRKEIIITVSDKTPNSVMLHKNEVGTFKDMDELKAIFKKLVLDGEF